MLSSHEIKDMLYSTINNIGKERIRSDISHDINLSKKYIEVIMAECITKINVESNVSSKNETIAVLGEALLHFMLTGCTIPSERKIQTKDNLILDVVIPNLQSLYRTPDKSIVIEIIRNKIDLGKISQLELIHGNCKNIWLLSVIPLSATRYRIYELFLNIRIFRSFSTIIIDIDNFLRETGDKSLRIIH